jgi:hypothetical protein
MAALMAFGIGTLTSTLILLSGASVRAQEKELAAGHPVRVEDAFYVPPGDGSPSRPAAQSCPTVANTWAYWRSIYSTGSSPEPRSASAPSSRRGRPKRATHRRET